MCRNAVVISLDWPLTEEYWSVEKEGTPRYRRRCSGALWPEEKPNQVLEREKCALWGSGNKLR